MMIETWIAMVPSAPVRVGCCICGRLMADGGVRLPADGAYKPGERACASCWLDITSPTVVYAIRVSTPECPDCRQATLDPFGGCTDAACPSNDLFRPRRLEAACATS